MIIQILPYHGFDNNEVFYFANLQFFAFKLYVNRFLLMCIIVIRHSKLELYQLNIK